MCLLIEQSETTNFSDQFLRDVYASNRDGVGVMYAEGGRVHVYKALPATAAEFVEFYDQHARGRACMVHARMQTHGDVDLGNCHPYRVTDDAWLAHNGILSTGNDWDKSRSDTWHFIRHVIAPALESDPARALDPVWQSFIGDLIGRNNKFGIVTSAGDSIVINRESGVEFNGAWLSNTYAWPAADYGVGVAPKRASWYQPGRWDGVELSRWSVRSEPQALTAAPSRWSGSSLERITRAARNCYIRGTLHRWVTDAPAKAQELASHVASQYEVDVDADPASVVQLLEEHFELESWDRAL